ncbi:MAG: lysozyme inhibitor LprI family protein [Campylobacteraceae bacterium]|jgi:uncharacterized protein YecT (DUF1311 family)|nr:lysozyme inhibitor LprI family protein [Campylobacteraceae bacterium]
MKKTLLLLTLTLTFLFPASFDCNKAKTDVEKLICSNEELSKLDEELNKAYKELLAIVNNDDKRMIIQEQREWIKIRDNTVELHDEFGMAFYYITRKLWLSNKITDLNHRSDAIKEMSKLQKTEHYPTYAEVLEDKTTSSPKSAKYEKVRPANSFQLIGGTKNPICKETIALFNEEGTYSQSDSNFDKLFWYLNNSGLVWWEIIENGGTGILDSYGKDQTFHLGLDYKEIDINNDSINEYVYRTGNIVHSQYLQKIHIYNQNIHNNTALLEKYKDPCEKIYGQGKCNNISLIYQAIRSRDYKEWQSTQEIDAAIRRVIYDKKSLDILYPNNSIKIARNTVLGENVMAEYEAQWNFYKIKSGVVLVLTPWVEGWKQVPEFLVFSLYKDKLATLECIMIPKEWQ